MEIAIPKQKEHTSGFMTFRDEEVICFCFGYTAGDIRQAIARGENTLDKLRESLEACDRCQGCRGEIQILLSEQEPS
jgi:NAD(P)H-nitrite reductase large subunit